jgi:formyl-CoA transferase
LNGPLSNVKVLDFGLAVAGPYASMLLAEMGAEVIKIEPPEGDEARGAAPVINGISAIFASSNKNKKSLGIDLKNPSSRNVVEKLFKWTNVVLENFRPGVRERLGISPEDAFKVNRDLVYVSIKGFRPDSKYGDLPAYDMIVQSMSGIMLSMGTQQDPPIRVPFALFDIFTGNLAALEILTGLISSKRPYYAEAYLFDTGIYSMNYLIQSFLLTGSEPKRLGGIHFSYAPHQPYMDSDGKWFTVAIVSDRQWLKLCDALGLEDLKNDKELLTNIGRVANRDRINARLVKLFSSKSRDYWIDILKKAGIPVAPVYSIKELFSDDYSNNLIYNCENLKLLSFPGKINGERPRPIRPPPIRQGSDSDEVLKELGFNDSEISRLKKEGVIK